MSTRRGLHVLSWIVLSVSFVKSARILCIFPTPSYSHQSVYEPVWQELVNRGHDVVVMTPLPPKENTKPNLQVIDWSATFKLNEDFMKSSPSPNGLMFYYMMWKLTDRIYEEQLSYPQVQEIINNRTEHFDLVMIEWFYPLMTAFSERFKCPLIGITSMPTQIFSFDAIGQPSHPIYNPEFVVPAAQNLNLLQRLLSGYVASAFRIFYIFFVIPNVDAIVEKHFGKNMRSVYEIERKVSLLLSNTNFALHAIRPNVPMVINFHGLHINSNNSLSQEYQNYLDEATEGVVYFSLGTNVKSSSLQADQIKMIVDAISELPYKVLWKWNGDELNETPKNVKTGEWFSQQSVLAHPNVIAFITQGGIQSLEEAIHYHVPIIGMPFYGDQHANIQMVVLKQLGLKVDYSSMTKELLKNVIIEVATNKMYKQNIADIASMLEDQPMKSLDLVIWWIEYAIRNEAEHMRSPLIDIPCSIYDTLIKKFLQTGNMQDNGK